MFSTLTKNILKNMNYRCEKRNILENISLVTSLIAMKIFLHKAIHIPHLH